MTYPVAELLCGIWCESWEGNDKYENPLMSVYMTQISHFEISLKVSLSFFLFWHARKGIKINQKGSNGW